MAGRITTPLLTLPLYILLRHSPETRDSVLRPLHPLLTRLRITPSTVVGALKFVSAIGLLSLANRALSRWALNHWKLNTGATPWDWPNEVCVVTGGCAGIGHELVLKLARSGMTVVILDVSPLPSSLQSLRNVHYFQCDITDQAAVNRVASEIRSSVGDPTILCNNAGVGRAYDILDVPVSYLEKVFHINLISHWYTVQAFLPAMLAGRKGHVVTTASMASFTAVAGMVDYCSSKAGALAFHEGLTQELKHRHNAPFVRTTSVHPYWVQTALIGDWETQLKALRNPIMTSEYVAEHIAKAILSGESGQVILPNTVPMNIATGARGMAKWLGELINDTTKDVTRNGRNSKQP